MLSLPFDQNTLKPDIIPQLQPTAFHLTKTPSNNHHISKNAPYQQPPLLSIVMIISPRPLLYLSTQPRRLAPSFTPSSSSPFFTSSFNPITLRHHSPIMSTSNNHYNSFELTDDSDFQKLVSPSSLISICGFGSLLSERSARSTFPDLLNFRVARLNGFRRVFAHTGPFFFERGIAKPETKEISSLSVEECEGETLVVTVFEIKQSEIPAFIEREVEFRFLAVVPEKLDGKPFDNPAVLCARYSDEEFVQIRCKGRKEIFFRHYEKYNIDRIWRDDILPCRAYLRHCVLAAKNLGIESYDNFLDHTFLGDRETTIRQYLMTTGAGIMEEEPPESVKTRYNG